MKSPSEYTWMDWINLAVFVIPSITGAGWYVQLLGEGTAAVITGMSATLVGCLNFMLMGRTPPQA